MSIITNKIQRFAISDIHGCLKTFQLLLEKIQLQPHDELYLLGDFIDRGNDSKGVIDYIIELQKKNYTITCLLGNHEWLLLNSTSDEKRFEMWIANGGAMTLESYGISGNNHIKQMPTEHLQFFRTLQYYVELDDYFLVHAGFNFKESDPFSDYESMLWIRDWQKNIKPLALNGKKIIHGHTPRVYSSIEKDVLKKETKVYNIDCGCVLDGIAFDGRLCAFNLNDTTITFQKYSL